MTTQRLIPYLLFPVALLLGCDPLVDSNEDGSTTSGAGSTGAPTTGASDPTVGTSPTPPPNPPQTSTDPYEPTTTGSGSSGSSGWDTSDGCDFIGCHDAGGHAIECSVIEQNCPQGEKCTPWANDGGSSWNAARCVPIVRDPDASGAPCTVEGSGVSGIDSCELGSMCWNVDAKTLEGTCYDHCTGSENAPVCPDPTQVCQISGDGVLSLCYPVCDPVTQADCEEGQGCYPSDNTFVCVSDASGEGGGPMRGCEFINACDPGTACVNPSLSESCEPGSAGCCLPWCDLETPNCPGDMVCTPWFEDGQAPKGQESVGLCVDESALP